MGNSRNTNDLVNILTGIWLFQLLIAIVCALCIAIIKLLLLIFAGACFVLGHTLDGFGWLWKNAKGER